MSSRERILNALKSSQKMTDSSASLAPFSEPLSDPVVAPVAETLAPSQWQQTFIQNLQDNHAEVIEVTASQLPDELAQQLQHQRIGRCVIGNSENGLA